MELLDRYLQAVKKHLPWQRQDDIFAELKANLESQLEDKDAPFGVDLALPQVGGNARKTNVCSHRSSMADRSEPSDV